MKNEILIIFLMVSVWACSGYVDLDQMRRYLKNPENGLRHEIQNNKLTYVLQYIPKEVMAYKEMRTGRSSIDQIKKELANLEYFHLGIINKQPGQETNTKKSFYYAFQFEQDIYQLINGDTIRPQLYLLEQGISGSSQISINLAFSEFTKEKETIVIADKFGITTQAHFKKVDISNIPNLNF